MCPVGSIVVTCPSVRRTDYMPACYSLKAHANLTGVLRLVGRPRVLVHDLHLDRDPSRRGTVPQADRGGPRARPRELLAGDCSKPLPLWRLRADRWLGPRPVRRAGDRVGGNAAARRVPGPDGAGPELL